MKTLQEQLDELKQEVVELKQIVSAAGLLNPWKTPTEAADIVSESAAYIRKQIMEARKSPRNSDLKCGVHYKFKGKRILVNVDAWKQYQALPPEKRRISISPN